VTLRSYEQYVWMMTGLRVRITWDTRALLHHPQTTGGAARPPLWLIPERRGC
jgi:hypothetical protein